MRHCSPDTRRRLVVATVVAALSALPGMLSGQRSDTVRASDTARTPDVARRLAPGVVYRRLTDPAGPSDMHLVQVDLRRGVASLRVMRAHDALRGREKVTGMVRRAEGSGARVLAAVNADFFWLDSGENENEQVLDGEWWKGLPVTDSPYDTFDNAHVQFALDAAGRPSMDRYILDASARSRGVTIPILALNHAPRAGPEGTAFYTPRFGASTPRDSVRPTAELPLAAVGRRGDTLLYVRRGAAARASGSAIPPDGAVLAAYGARAAEVQAIAGEGDTVRVLLGTLPRPPVGRSPVLLIGGWPRILQDGESVAARAATVEGTLSRNAEVRHPRTALGFSRDSATLYLLVVDGRSRRSAGVTLVELARIMRRLGAWQAMNFDGGGSTAMVVGGATVNVPSDSAGERAVGNALLVLSRQRIRAPSRSF